MKSGNGDCQNSLGFEGITEIFDGRSHFNLHNEYLCLSKGLGGMLPTVNKTVIVESSYFLEIKQYGKWPVSPSSIFVISILPETPWFCPFHI